MAIIPKLKEFIFKQAPKKGPPISYVMGGRMLQPIERSTEGYLRAYGELGWLYASVSRIASAVGDIRWHLYSVRNGDRKEIDSHALLNLLDYVNPFQTGEELFEASQQYLDLVGECFWILNRNRLGMPAEIWIAPPQNMKVVPSREKFISGFVYGHGQDAIPLETTEVIFLKYPNPSNPYRGLGPAQSIGLELDTDKYAAEWNRAFFYNDASSGTVITYPGTLSDEEYERLREQWQSRHRGVEQAHKVAILSGQAKVERINLSQHDMGFVDMRKMNRDAILGAFGIPLSVLGIVENVNRANAEAGEYTFGRWVLRPRLTRWREKLNEQLCPMFGEELELDFDDPVPENRELKITEAERGVRGGFLTVNEARTMLGFESLASGNVFLLPLGAITQPSGSQTKVLNQPLQIKAAQETRGAGLSLEVWKASIDSRELRFRRELEDYFEEQKWGITSKLEALKLVKKQLPEEIFDYAEAAASASNLGRRLITGLLKEAADQAVRDYALGISFDLENPLVREWLGSRMATFSRDITDTTREAITEQLRQGHAAGESIDKLADRISGYFDQQGPMRAERIARTETVYASNRGAIEAYRQSGVVNQWEWLVAYNPCPMCEPYQGKRFGLDDPLPPFLHPNCRCVSAGIVQEITELRSIRCVSCNKLLGKGIIHGEIACPRCRTVWKEIK